MTGVSPRRLVHRGFVDAAAVLVSRSHVGEGEARRRALALLEPGARLFGCADGYMVKLPSPRRLLAEAAPGAALTEQGGVLGASPLSARELAALAARPGSFVLCEGGVCVARAAHDLAEIDPASFVDTAGFEVADVASLGADRPVARQALEPRQAGNAELLVPRMARDPAIAEVERALREKPPAEPPPSEGAPSLPMVLFAFVGRFLSTLAGLLTRLSTPPAPGAGPPPEGASKSTSMVVVTRPRPAPEDALGKLAARLSTLAARILHSTRLSRLVKARHEEYLEDTLDKFKRGDLDEALRCAIPLSADKGEPAPDRIKLSLPSPRGRLEIVGAAGDGAAAGPAMVSRLFDELRATYERAFAQLEQAGRFEEAAFVLAELLGKHEEAVAFLERVGKLRLAAEVAEARQLAPGLVVRQWFLAGEHARGLAIARSKGAFADAIARLEGTASAAALRVLWADVLCSSGDFEQAIAVLLKVDGSERLRMALINRLIARGGPAGARFLIEKLRVDPSCEREVRAAALALLSDESAAGARTRAALAQALTLAPPVAGVDLMARAAIRALLRDHARGLLVASQSDLAALSKRLPDSLLGLGVTSCLGPAPSSGVLRVEVHERGTVSIVDAVPLPGGRIALGLGEIGVEVRERDGKLVARFEQPAHALVVSDFGDRLIALAPRGEVTRLSRIDLSTMREQPWGELPLDAFAPTFDGASWAVVSRGDLLSLDALAAGVVALSRVAGLDGKARAIGRNAGSLSVAVEGEGLSMWVHDPATLTLRRKVALRGSSARAVVAASGDGNAAMITLGADKSVALQVARDGDARSVSVGDAGGVSERGPLFFDGALMAVGCAGGSEVHVQAAAAPFALRAVVTMPGASRAFGRAAGDALVVCDDRGRVLAIDIERGTVLARYRV